jgi:citrate lyase subunit gamma (acyl carrier protein)
MVSKAGNPENSDCEVVVKKGNNLVINSKVQKIYGKTIEKSVKATLKELDAGNLDIEVKDFGALDYVMKARIETAVRKFRGEK